MKTLSVNQQLQRPTPNRRPRLASLLAALFALALVAAACGGDEVVEAGAGGDETGQLPTESDPTESDPTESDPTEDGSVEVAPGYELTKSHPELISAQKAVIDSVATVDQQTLAVRYASGAEPCTQSNVTVTETEESVTLLLETGLNPDAAAMSCIAQVIDYEIRVTLDAPLGDREIVLDQA